MNIHIKNPINKNNVFSLIAICLSVIALVFSYLQWTVSVNQRNDQLLPKYEAEVYCDFNRECFIYHNDIYNVDELQFQLDVTINNTGIRTISIEDIEAFFWQEPERRAGFSSGNNDLTDNNSEKVLLPIAIEPGHSKKLFCKVNLPLESNIANMIKNKYENSEYSYTLYRILGLLHNNNTLLIERNGKKYILLLEMNIHGAKSFMKYLDLDEIVK